MWFTSKWWDQKKIESLTKQSRDLKYRYLKFMHTHAREIRCSSKCEVLMREKRSAKLAWLCSELELKEALLERIAHTA